MKYNVVEDRHNVKRYVSNNMDDQLIEMRGERYAAYRKEFELARINHIRPDRPTQISFEINSWCNLECKMCFWSYRNKPKRNYLPLTVLEDIARQAKELQIPSLWLGAFTEPMLHPQFTDVLRIIEKAEPVDYWITTNATVMTEEISDIITDIPLTKLSISLDAASAETYKKIRGGNLDAVERNIDKFLEVRSRKNSKLPFLRVTFVEQDENRHEVEAFIDKWKDIADVVDIQTLFDFSWLQKKPEEIPDSELNNFKCPEPFYHLTIRHDGRYSPCCNGMYESDSYVNVKDMSILDYWRSPELIEFARKIDQKIYEGCCRRCLASVNL